MRIATILLLLALGLNYREEAEFLSNAGFPHLMDNFRDEEVVMRMTTHFSNQDLTGLGLSTTGARLRFREAVNEWIQRDANGEDVELPVGEERAAPENGRGDEVKGERRNENPPNNERDQRNEAAVEVEIDPVVGIEGVIDDESNLVFYAKTLSTGRVTHHFLNHFYRFDRNKVRANGRAFFQCSVRGCTAR